MSWQEYQQTIIRLSQRRATPWKKVLAVGGVLLIVAAWMVILFLRSRP